MFSDVGIYVICALARVSYITRRAKGFGISLTGIILDVTRRAKARPMGFGIPLIGIILGITRRAKARPMGFGINSYLHGKHFL